MSERAVLVETSRDLPLVSFTVASKVGGATDPPGLDGLTRFTARLMRRTGGGLTPHEIDTRIDSLGGSLGAEVSSSAAGFSATVIRRSFDSLVDVLCDVLGRPGLAAEELERLARESVADIVEARDDDSSLARRFFRRSLFRGHPYGRALSGTTASIPRITRSAVEEKRRQTFAAGNLILAFAGDLERDEAMRATDRLVGAVSAGEHAHDAVTEPSEVPGRRLVIVDKPERTQTQILIGCLGTHAQDDDHIALHVANTIFGGTFTARLTREVRAKRGWSYGAYSSLPIDRQRQAFSMWTFPKAADAGPCIALELELLEAWRRDGVTAEELAFAQSYLIRSHAFSIDTAAKRVGLTLDVELYDLPADYYAAYTERVRAVTLDQANAAVRKRISAENLLVTVVGTESVIGSAVRGAIPNLASSEVVSFDAD